MRIDNASLAKKLSESSIASIVVVSWSFENALQQVEHFRYPLPVSREQVQSNICLKMEDLSHLGINCPFLKYNTLHWEV